MVADRVLLDWPIQCVRLWQQDARAAVASGNLGLAVLSPLMYHADAAVVEAAVTQVLQQIAAPQQADLLSILGVFAGSLLVLPREVGHVIREGREGRKGSDMPIRFLVALGEKVCRMPVFPSRKRPNWHRWCNLFASFASFVDQLRVVLLVVQREVGHVIREGRAGRKGSDMPIRFLVALGEKVCRMPVFPSRKRPNWHRWCNLFASFASFVDQLRVVLLVERFGKEKFMASEFINYLVSDKLAELETRLEQAHAAKLAQLEAERAQAQLVAEHAQREAERAQAQLIAEHAQREAERVRAEHAERMQVQSFQSAIEDAIMARFPSAPFALVSDLRRTTDPVRLRDMLVATVRAADVESLTTTLRQLAA